MFSVKSLLVVTFLLVHNWYPTECCSGKDCTAVPCDTLAEQTDGTIKYLEFTFTKDQIRPSLDKDCHVCIAGSTPRCVFIQTNT
jgi:hypothetical protein